MEGQFHQKLHLHDERSIQQEVHMHDDGVQKVNVGIDRVEYARVISEARSMLEESESKSRSLEGLAQSVYQQACTQIQHLMTVADELKLSCVRGESSIQALQND